MKSVRINLNSSYRSRFAQLVVVLENKKKIKKHKIKPKVKKEIKLNNENKSGNQIFSPKKKS